MALPSGRWRGLLVAFALSACVEQSGPIASEPAPDVAVDVADAQPPVETHLAAALKGYVPGPMAMRRLTRVQYVATIRALFGDDLEVLPRRRWTCASRGSTRWGPRARH